MAGGVRYEVPTIEEIYRYLARIAKEIRDRGISVDVIVGIARGGLVPARFLADFLLVSDIKVVSAGFYVAPGKRMDKPVIYTPITEDLSGKTVLLVDDVADTGETLIEVQRHLRERGAERVYTAVIYVKPWNKAKVDFYAKETSAWIIFPWERVETAKQIGEKDRREMERIVSSDRLYSEVAKLFLGYEAAEA